jgi:hypothetical protein
MKTLRSLLSDIIEVIDTLESLKSPKPRQDSNYYVPKPLTPDEAFPQQTFGGTGIELITTEFAQQVAEALESANLGEVTAVSEQTEKEQDSDPEENAHNAAMFTSEPEEAPPEPEPEKKPARKPRQPKAPPAPKIDIGAVRQEVAEVISVMVTEGKKDIIKSVLATYGVDWARELPDE